MSERPIVLMLTKMHESGMAILREAVELRATSALDPTTLAREAADVDAIIIRTQSENKSSERIEKPSGAR